MCAQVWHSNYTCYRKNYVDWWRPLSVITGSVSILLQHSVLTVAAEARADRQIAEQGDAPLACQSQWESPPSDSTRTPSQNDWTVAWRAWSSLLISFMVFQVWHLRQNASETLARPCMSMTKMGALAVSMRLVRSSATWMLGSFDCRIFIFKAGGPVFASHHQGSQRHCCILSLWIISVLIYCSWVENSEIKLAQRALSHCVPTGCHSFAFHFSTDFSKDILPLPLQEPCKSKRQFSTQSNLKRQT